MGSPEREGVLRILGVVGSTTPGGRTETVVRRVLDAAGSHDGVVGDVLRLDPAALAPPDLRRAEERTGATREMLDAIDGADMVVLGTPMHRSLPSVALKQCLDLVPPGGFDGDFAPLRAKPVAVVTTALLPHYFSAPGQLVGILVDFFAAWVVPPAIYAHEGDFDERGDVVDEAVVATADAVGAALVSMAHARRQAPALAAPKPQLQALARWIKA